MDVAIVKDATARVTLGSDRTAVIDYEARVRNSGPNQAHNVTLADPSPSGVTFLSITQQPSQGGCTLGASLLSCNFGTLGGRAGDGALERAGQRDRLGPERRHGDRSGHGHQQREQHRRRGDGRGRSADPAGAGKPKPRPKPAAQVCRTLSVGPKLLRATGQRQLVTDQGRRGQGRRGRQGPDPGPGINHCVTNAKGLIRVTLRPSKAGILRFTITNARACNAADPAWWALRAPVTG